MDYQKLKQATEIWGQFTRVCSIIERMEKQGSKITRMQDISEAMFIFYDLSPGDFEQVENIIRQRLENLRESKKADFELL